MSQDSLKAYQAERANATKPPQAVNTADAKNNPARSTYQNTDQYMNKRTTIINNYNNIVYNSPEPEKLKSTLKNYLY